MKAGDPLVIMDDGDYTIAVAQTEAQIVTQGKTLERIAAQTEAAQGFAAAGRGAEGRRRKPPPTNAVRGADRAAQLVKTKVGTQAQLDDAQTAVDQTKAALAGADAQIASAKANIGVLRGAVCRSAEHAAHARADPRQGQARPVLHGAARAL